MKKLFPMVLLLASMIWAGAGCTPTETSAQRERRISQITDLQMRMAVEDWDYIWLYEKNSGCTQWHPWVGI
jgi:hypothetical protein